MHISTIIEFPVTATFFPHSPRESDEGSPLSSTKSESPRSDSPEVLQTGSGAPQELPAEQPELVATNAPEVELDGQITGNGLQNEQTVFFLDTPPNAKGKPKSFKAIAARRGYQPRRIAPVRIGEATVYLFLHEPYMY